MNRITGRQAAGFSLMEMLVAVVVVGILASVAIPSYQESVAKAHRADARAALEGLAQAMERHYAANFTYEGAAASGANTGAPASTVFGYTKTPREGADVRYNLRITAATRNTYTLQAQPTGASASDACGTYQLLHTGVRSNTGSGSGCR